MRKLIVFLALMVIPARLPAFSTQDALGLVAMPLAVAAVSDVPAVPQDQLADIVATLNQADVSPVPFVVERDYISTSTVVNVNPLALIALPLAVASVSDISGIPQSQLADLVSTLNNANVPVVQEIQVIRYAPVALTADNGQPFVQFVQTQVDQGITGPALVPVVTQQIQTFVPEQRIVLAPQQA